MKGENANNYLQLCSKVFIAQVNLDFFFVQPGTLFLIEKLSKDTIR